MASRILTWHLPSHYIPNERIGPAYYMEADYTPIAVRINAEIAPRTHDAEFDIKDDGVSILANRASNFVTPTIVSGTKTGDVVSSDPSKTTAILPMGDNGEDAAEDFNNDIIELGSWITCTALETGAGKNFTVHLELEKVSEEMEED